MTVCRLHTIKQQLRCRRSLRVGPFAKATVKELSEPLLIFMILHSMRTLHQLDFYHDHSRDHAFNVFSQSILSANNLIVL